MRLRNRTQPECRDHARKMRRGQTPAERAAWAVLRRGGRNTGRPRWLRQAIIRGFIVDFYCPKARLILEIDGPSHDGQAQQTRDTTRPDAIRRLGIEVYRLANHDLLERDPAEALAPVLDLAHRRAGDLSPETKESKG